MTPLHQDLTRLGFADLLTESGKTAGLRWIEGGVCLYINLKVDVEGATWEHERDFRGDAGVNEAKAALMLWKLTQAAATKALQVSDCG